MKIERHVRLSFVAMFQIKAIQKHVNLLKKKPILWCAGGVEWTKDRDEKCLSNPMHLGGLNVIVKRKH